METSQKKPKKNKINTQIEVEQAEQTTPRVLGGDITNTDYAELSCRFDEFAEFIKNKTYNFELERREVSYLLHKFFPTVEWTGQQAWGLSECYQIIKSLPKENVTTVSMNNANLKGMLHLLATKKYCGISDLNTIKQILLKLSNVIQTEILKDEQDLRDAGYELQAAEQGILPETKSENLQKAEVVS